MSKLFLFLLISLFGLSINHFSFSMQEKEEKISEKRKREQLEQESTDNTNLPDDQEVEQREQKRRRIEGDQEGSGDSDNEHEILDNPNSIVQQINLKSAEELASEGLNGLPAELLLMIFEVDFNKFLKQEIWSKDEPKVYRDDIAKSLLKQAIDHINKYCFINKKIGAVIFLYLPNQISKLIYKFGIMKFFEIVRMPGILRKFFKKFEKNPNAFSSLINRLPKIKSTAKGNDRTVQFTIDFSIQNIDKSKRNETRIHPAEGSAFIGFLIRNNFGIDFICKSFQIHGFTCINFIGSLKTLDKLFCKEGYCLTPLMWAVFCGHDKLVELLSKHSDVNAICSPNKMSKEYESGTIEPRYKNVNVLSLAKTEKIMKLLENAGVEKEVKCLSIFIKYADLDAIKYYFNDIDNASDEKKNQFKKALILAVKFERKDVLEYVFSNFRESDYLKFGEVIFYASKYQNIEVLKFLLMHAQDLFEIFQDKKGNTALMVAAKKGNVEIVQLLLEHGFGATTDFINQKGMHALMLALNKMKFCREEQKKKYRKIARLLEKYDTNISEPVETNAAPFNGLYHMYPISQTNDPKLITLFYLNIMKKSGLSSEEIDQMIKKERERKNQDYVYLINKLQIVQ